MRSTHSTDGDIASVDELAPWFAREELEDRNRRAQQEMNRAGIDLLLAFEPESVTYLTGFFTNGYGNFQLALIPVAGEPTVICRDIFEFYRSQTSPFSRRLLWSDGDDHDRLMVKAVIDSGASNATIGLEMSAWPLRVNQLEALRSRLPHARLVDASEIVRRLRWIKSPAEINYMRAAAAAGDAAIMAGVAAAVVPGARERDVAIAVSRAQVEAGSDGAEPGPIASGLRARHVFGSYTDRQIVAGDTVHLEADAHRHHYHVRCMRTLKVGQPSRTQAELATALLAIQDEALAQVRPGSPAAEADATYRSGIEPLVGRLYTNKTFYSLGFVLPPNDGEGLAATPNAAWSFAEGMTLHTYLAVDDLAFSETILVTADGAERFSTVPRRLISIPLE